MQSPHKAKWLYGAVALVGGSVIVILGASWPREHARVEARAASRAADAASPEAEPGDPTEPDFPTVEGRYPLTREWSIELPGRFKRRVEEENLYLWRPGLTLVIALAENAEGKPPAAQLSAIKGDVSPEAYDKLEETQGALTRFAYRLHEPAEDARRDAFYGFSVGNSGYVQLEVYFDDEADVAVARALWRSVVEARQNIEARDSAREQDQNAERSPDASR